jgi:sugar/nucleoside kinase (ribokinase family)
MDTNAKHRCDSSIDSSADPRPSDHRDGRGLRGAQALLVVSTEVADQVREDLMPLEDDQQVRISLTALTPQELAALPDDDRWWSDVVRDARVLKGSAPEAAKRQVTKATA